MNLKTYHAYTMAEALAAVKQDLGHDAVILHTRSFKRGGVLGVGRRTVVEVTATPAESAGPRRPAVARRDAPRRAAAGRAYGGMPAVATRPAVERSVSAGGVTTRDPGPERMEAARQRLVHRGGGTAVAPPVTSLPSAAAPRGAGSSGVVVSAAARPDPVSAAGPVDGGPRDHGRPVESVARRFILQPTAAPTSADPPAAAGPPTTTRAVEVAGPPAPEPDEPPPAAKTTASREPIGIAMQEELAAIRKMVGQVLERQRTPAASPMADLPPPLFDQYVRLTSQDLSGELAERLLRAVAATLPEGRLDDADLLEEAIIEAIAGLLPVADQPVADASPDGRPLTVALVGPTGVGKTTTLAKLAAMFKLGRGRRVGLVTADTYRIAAVDQLRTYANIIGLPLEVALTPADIRRSIHTLSDRDVILVDTAGRSQNDRRRIDELREFMTALDPHEVHLVLSCTASERVLLQEAEAFGVVGAHKVAITKLDEAVSYGVIVNVLHAIDLSLSFVTTGQEVPDHIEPGSGRRIAELLVGRAVREPSTDGLGPQPQEQT